METTRRDFMKTSLVVAGFSGLALREAPPAIKKGLVFDMVPAHLSYADRFKLVRNATLWGSDTVLLVPAVVNAQTSYRDAWTRSQAQIRKLIPLAAELKVVIAIEEVWNKFLLSPLEMVQYIGEFHSPWVQAWFDVGNVVLYGYPQDWIRTLGKRIVKVHLKDFKRKEGGYEWVNLGDGDVD